MGQGTHTNLSKLVSWLILRWALDSKHGSTTLLEHSKLLNSHSKFTLFAFLVGHRITSRFKIQRTTTFVTPCASATDFSSLLERGELDRCHSMSLNVFYSPIRWISVQVNASLWAYNLARHSADAWSLDTCCKPAWTSLRTRWKLNIVLQPFTAVRKLEQFHSQTQAGQVDAR